MEVMMRVKDRKNKKINPRSIKNNQKNKSKSNLRINRKFNKRNKIKDPNQLSLNKKVRKL